MKNKCINIHAGLFMLLVTISLWACKKADNFYEKLDTIPQISNESRYQYKAAYGVGDTLTITGLLHPENNLVITVGGIDAPIAKLDSVSYAHTTDDLTGWLHQASVVITDAMGIGDNRAVSVSSGGYTTNGAAIQIYGLGGEGSLDKPLRLERLAPIGSRQNIYLNCVNGKGDIYYYGYSDGILYHLKKDGTQEQLLSTEQLATDQGGRFTIFSFIAGGVNPQGTMAWMSVQTSSGYRFCEIDLSNKTVTTLNEQTSAALTAPYEGNIGNVHTLVSGIFPDADGNVYLYIGPAVSGTYQTTTDNSAMAVARYSKASGKLQYVFKTGNAQADMPGAALDLSGYGGISLRINPQDASLYVFSQIAMLFNDQVAYVTGIHEYSLSSGIKLSSFVPNNIQAKSLIYLGPMSNLRMALGFNGAVNTLDASVNFGMMPMPGRRLIFLYTGDDTDTFPKWEVVDWSNSKLYQWAPERCNMNGFSFRPSGSSDSRIDQLLNYDEDGHLYMTADGRSSFVTTHFQ